MLRCILRAQKGMGLRQGRVWLGGTKGELQICNDTSIPTKMKQSKSIIEAPRKKLSRVRSLSPLTPIVEEISLVK